MKAIVFSRVSTQAQDLDQQTETLITYCKSIGYTDDNIITIQMKESGISLSEEEREGISLLKSAVLQDKDIDTVICWEISRIARRLDVVYSVNQFFIEHHIRWIVHTPYMELTDKEGNQSATAALMMAIFSSFAESEMKIKKERARRVVEYRKKMNKFAGGKILYGYSIDKDNNFVIDIEKSKLIRKIFNMYSGGNYSFRSLAKELKQEGWFENVSNHSLPSRISKYINDERYTGINKAYPQIIDTELFKKCKEIISKQNIISRPENPAEMLCKGLIFDRNRKVALIPGFGKGVYSIHPDYGRPCLTISSKYIDKLIFDFTQEMIIKYLSNKELIEKQLTDEMQLTRRKISYYTIETGKIKEKINRTEERYIEGNITKEKADELTKKFRNELVASQSSLESFNTRLNRINESLGNITPVNLDDEPFERKREYVKHFIDKIEIEKEKPLARRSNVYIHCKTDHNIYVYLLYSQNSKYPNKVKSPYLVRIEPETEM